MRRATVRLWDFTYILQALLLAVSVLLWAAPAHALVMQNRSVRIGTALPSATTTYDFQFDYTSTGIVGSVQMEFCSNSSLFEDPCTAPVGLSLSSAVLTSQTGNIGFSIDGVNSTATKLVLTRAATPSLAVPSSYDFSGAVNPSGNNTTTYVRISTYVTTDATGLFTDNGAVAYSTVGQFSVGAYVPPFLIMCVGLTVAVDCSAQDGFNLDLGVLNQSVTRAATSQFSTGTNDSTGYNVFVLGSTMTSGNNVIPGMASPGGSSRGTSQFGLNLRNNSNPDVGEDPVGGGTALPASPYNTPNTFSFQPGSLVASSPISTDFNRMTVAYVVNVSGAQAAGVYSTTMTYLGIAQF